MKRLLTILLTLALSSACAFAAAIHVPADQPTIQAGINAAVDGDTVLVADGTYTGEGNREIEFHGKAIILRSQNGPENCIIDAESAGYLEYTAIRVQEGENRNTVINGFTVTDGDPAGILIDEASPTIRNCVIKNSTYGIHITGVDLRYVYTLIESTRVRGNGIGIKLTAYVVVMDSEITGNGQGISSNDGSHYLFNCLIAGNSSGSSHGGGLGLQRCYTRLTNCTIADNHAVSAGGGIYLCFATCIMKNCIISGNHALTGDQLYLDGIYEGVSDVHISFSDVNGYTYVGEGSYIEYGPGMMYENPIFEGGPWGEYFLSQTAAGQTVTSRCADSGDPDSLMVFGTTRTDTVQDSGVVDMGYHYRDPDVGHLPDTIVLSGPAEGFPTSSPAVVFTFTGTDRDHPSSSLMYSWRFNDEPWSPWSYQRWASISFIEDTEDITFEVRARDPGGDIDPIPAIRTFDCLTRLFDYSVSPYLRAFVVGPGPGPANPPLVRTSMGQWMAYTVMRFGVNVAAGDIDGDGTDEVITGPGPGTVFGPHVRCFQPDGTVIQNAGFMAYGTLKYGVKVAAGDVDGDGHDEIITGAGPGAVFGPHVRGWNWDGGPTPVPIPGISFFAYGTLRWGVNVTCGDLNADGIDEIITGPGPGAIFGAHVRGWRYDGGTITPMHDINFFAFENLKWGATVACGDLNGDDRDEIITGVGPCSDYGPLVRAWNFDGSSISQMPGVDFMAYPYGRHGVVVGAADYDDDGSDEVLTIPGPGASNLAWLRVWKTEAGVDLHRERLAFDSWMTHGGNVAGSKNGWEPSVHK